MASLKSKDIAKMDVKSRTEKIKDLQMELMKSYVGTQKSTGKTKGIKRAIARLKTFNVAEKAKKK